MNRFVLIGNGFDLAHDFKTSYGDFLIDYFLNHFNNLKQSNISEDELIEVRFNPSFRHLLNEDFIANFKNIDDIKKSSWVKLKYPEIIFRKIDNHFDERIQISFKSIFFYELLVDENWTDIEKTYFDRLLKLFERIKIITNRKVEIIQNITELNNDFEFLKMEINKYLKKVNENTISKMDFTSTKKSKNNIFRKIKMNPDSTYINRYFSSKYRDLFKNKQLSNLENEISSINIIDFNYTNTVKKYIELNFNQIKTFYHKIHGEIKEPDSIIFGYGDDSHASYQELEDFDNEELLKYIKSFYYPNQKCYLDIINALEEDEFDVFVIGHSLGLSDRVLLRSIFEHEKCRAIKLFHRGSKENQFKKRIALSRHFKDKALMRKRIVDYDDLDKFF